MKYNESLKNERGRTWMHGKVWGKLQQQQREQENVIWEMLWTWMQEALCAFYDFFLNKSFIIFYVTSSGQVENVRKML